MLGTISDQTDKCFGDNYRTGFGTLMCNESIVGPRVNVRINVSFFLVLQSEALKTVAMSTLVNLCYQNMFSVTVLVNCVHLDQFRTKIQSYGLLSMKMVFILSKYTIWDYQQLAKCVLEVDTHLR